jgi:hypothetical protein
VALTFPKLRAKYGEKVTYAESPKAHIRTEFGFDITQVAKKRYTSDQYHDFIGFQVSKPLLERAFRRTYGLPLEKVLGHEDLAVGTFRRAVSLVIPEMTRAALVAYHPEIVKETPNFSKELFLYNLSRAQYEAEWGKDFHKPGFFARVMGWFVRCASKMGISSALDFKLPTPQTEDLCIKSVNRTVENYGLLLREVGNGQVQFPNTDCDTGRETSPGEYALSDETYGRLLETLFKVGLEGIEPDLRANILAFYGNPNAPPRTGKVTKAWQRTVEEVEALKAGPNSEVAAEIRKRLLAPPFKLQSPKAEGE